LFFENRDYNDFWRQPGFGMEEYLDRFPVMPMLSVVGWYEIYTRSIVETHQAMVRKGRKNQYLLAGPWTHANTDASCGDVNFGSGASKIPDVGSFERFQVQWFNRWLKDDSGAELGQPIKIFVMGGGDGRRGEGGRLNHGGAWHTGNVWPPEQSTMTNFYLQSGGVLSAQKPNVQAASTEYDYDPRNTLSSDGRCEIDYGPAAGHGFTGMGPRDQIQHRTLPGHGEPGKPVAARKDVLVFQTAPLEHDLTMAGDLRAHLKVSSDAPDTDFYVKLIDVYPASKDYPSGYAFPVTDGVLRARYRNGFEKPQPLEAGKVYDIAIPLQPAANLFKAGHRIRIDISSSSFPNFDINTNTGNPRDPSWRIAHNAVQHDRIHASSIELPIFRNGKP
jgi:putative CocE/NonD family hydrolase